MHNHLVGFGEAVGLHVGVEELRRHERHFPRAPLFVPFRLSYLLQAVVLSDVEPCEVNDDFLADAVVEEEVIGVDGECQCRSLVLDRDAFEHVARFVGGYDTTCHDVVGSVVLGAYFRGVVGGVVPELALEVEDGCVGLPCGHGAFGAELGGVDVVLA